MKKIVTWITKDGKEIPIKSMKDSHLVNTIRFMRKAYMDRYSKAEAMADFFDVETAAADLADSNLMNTPMTPDGNPQFEALVCEAKKRKLDVEEG